MRRFRIMPVFHCGNPQKHVIGFRIQESVSQCGMYIEWNGLFRFETSAVAHIEATTKQAIALMFRDKTSLLESEQILEVSIIDKAA